jgi:glycolate oxidase FAD binding subunit
MPQALDAALTDLRDRVIDADRARTPLRLRGAGSKDFYAEGLSGDILDTRKYSGIVSYEPSELVVTARCGTPLAEVEGALESSDQFLPFEPPTFGGAATIGGVVASGLSGPRRASAGGVRDYVLGAHLMDSTGHVLRFGGQVMKNVAGFDVARLLCGSLGILGLITQVSLKVLPRPRSETTLSFEFDRARAIELFNQWAGRPLPISATSWQAGRAYVRLSGAGSAVRAAHDTLGGEVVDDATAAFWWRSLRDQTQSLFNFTPSNISGQRLWRLSLPSTAPSDSLDALLVEWSGALRWLQSDAPPEQVRAAAARVGGTAAVWRGPRETTMFHPLQPSSLELHRRLKRQFDPHGIFNPGRLIADL